MLAKDFEVDDLVWAKMKNFPPWPGKIAEPPTDAKPRKGWHYVFFFGSENYAWMKDENIDNHAEDMIPPTSKKKTALLQTAIDEIIKLSEDRPFKIARNIESNESSFFATSPKRKSPKENKLKDKKSPKIKIGRKSLTYGKSVKRSLGYSRPPRARKPDDESSSGDVDMNASQIAFISSNGTDLTLLSSYGNRLPDSNRAAKKPAKKKKRKHVPPTSKKIGFLGFGNMGQNIVQNLLNSGHDVKVWNRSASKYVDLINWGAVADSPAEVVKASDIIFCCVSDSAAVKSLVFGHNGVLKGLEDSNQMEGCKGYVEMTSIDFETSIEISEAIEIKGGRYLEASVVGSKKLAEEGRLLLLASGSKELFTDCKTCFHAISNVAYYLGSDVGRGSKYSLIMSAMMGSTFAAMAEALALAERTNTKPSDVLNCLQMKGFTCPEVIDRAKYIISHKIGPLKHNDTPLKHQQKDMDLTLLMSNQFPQPMPVTTAANELYKHAKLLGYAEHDIASVFYGAKY